MPCMQWGTLTDICPQWGMGEERRISGMYAAGTLSDTCPQWGMGEERRISGIYAVGDV